MRTRTQHMHRFKNAVAGSLALILFLGLFMVRYALEGLRREIDLQAREAAA